VTPRDDNPTGCPRCGPPVGVSLRPGALAYRGCDVCAGELVEGAASVHVLQVVLRLDGAGLAQVLAAARPSGLVCPRCGGALARITLAGREVDACRPCGLLSGAPGVLHEISRGAVGRPAAVAPALPLPVDDLELELSDLGPPAALPPWPPPPAAPPAAPPVSTPRPPVAPGPAAPWESGGARRHGGERVLDFADAGEAAPLELDLQPPRSAASLELPLGPDAPPPPTRRGAPEGPAPRPSPARVAPRPARRGPAVAAIAAALGLVAVGVGATYGLRGDDAAPVVRADLTPPPPPAALDPDEPLDPGPLEAMDFGGQSLAWWRARLDALAEDPSARGQQLYSLTKARAEAMGFVVDRANGAHQLRPTRRFYDAIAARRAR